MGGASKIDTFYRKFILTKFYTKGWGKPDHLKEIIKKHKNISIRENCCKLITEADADCVHIDSQTTKNNITTIHGHLKTPLLKLSPELVNPDIQKAKFEFIVPANSIQKKQDSKGKKHFPIKSLIEDMNLKPVCIHLAGTGDHGFHRRRELLAKPLLKYAGISSLLLENPYYGSRKPKEQTRSGLLYVTDLFIMGSCLILESQILLHWLKRQGFGPLGLTGISMGGHMASLAATNWPEPISLVPCMSWSSSSVVWTEGVLSKAISWKVLEKQLLNNPTYYAEIVELIKHHFDSYQLGQEFILQFSKVQRLNGINYPIRSNINFKNITTRTSDKEKIDFLKKQTTRFMNGVMDQITHLGNYSIPVDTSLVTFVIAKNDGYYPTHNLTPMTDIWPDCEVRTINTGHVTGFLMHQSDFLAAIVDTFERQINKYYVNESFTDNYDNSHKEASL